MSAAEKAAGRRLDCIVRSAPRRGTSATELVCVLPVLVLIVFGAIDLGRAAHDYAALGSAVRAGAERGATRKFTDYSRPAWEAQVRAAVSDELTGSLGPAARQVQISVVTNRNAGALPSITVSGTYDFEPSLAWPGVGKRKTFQRQMTIREFR
jgi:Flp pilus assembly protein TadG